MLGGVQFWACSLVVEVLFCESNGRVLGGTCSLGCWWKCCFATDGRVLGGMQFRVLVGVLFCQIDGRVLGVFSASL